MAEAIDPAELGQFLSSFRARISAPAARYGGVVDKYIGDAVMVVFGAPHPRTDDAARALACALAMVDAMDEWSRDRLRRGRGAVAVSIAAHFGDAFAGVLSDGRLLEYTVRSEEHTSELQPLMRISYAVFCLKNKHITE